MELLGARIVRAGRHISRRRGTIARWKKARVRLNDEVGLQASPDFLLTHDAMLAGRLSVRNIPVRAFVLRFHFAQESRSSYRVGVLADHASILESALPVGFIDVLDLLIQVYLMRRNERHGILRPCHVVRKSEERMRKSMSCMLCLFDMIR
jgi:hypothetical protein